MPTPINRESILTQFYLQHHGWLTAWLNKRLGGAPDVADLAHDTFLRLLARDVATSSLKEPRAFLTTVAQGLVANYFRRRDIEQAWLDTLASQPEQIAVSPETRALILETLEAIDTALAGLPVKARQAFLMAQLEGMSYAEIARELNVSVSSIKKYMMKAIALCYFSLPL